MKAITLLNANASVISVTNSAGTLLSLIDTAASGSHSNLTGANAVDLTIEDGDVRMLTDGNTPSASKGMLLKRGATYHLRNVQVNLIKLIRAGSANVNVGVSVGYTEPGESSSVSFVPFFHDLLSGEDPDAGVMKVENRGGYFNISSATTTVVKSGAGHINSIRVIGGTLGNVTVYDNTSGSGTVICPTVTPVANGVLIEDVDFTTGLTIVTAAATIITGSFR